jgi:TPR repeat protein
MYLQGRAVKQDFARAFRLFLKAAQSGYAIARNNLAIMYPNGQAVAKDYVWADAWLNVASEQISGCSDLRDRIAKEMRPDEIIRARDLAARKRAELSEKAAQSK